VLAVDASDLNQMEKAGAVAPALSFPLNLQLPSMWYNRLSRKSMRNPPRGGRGQPVPPASRPLSLTSGTKSPARRLDDRPSENCKRRLAQLELLIKRHEFKRDEGIRPENLNSENDG
jgi:hypothetical protein